MKSFIIAIILLLVVVATLITTDLFLANSTDRNSRDLQEVYDAVEREDWDAATELIHKAHENWDEDNFLYSILIDHLELDNIELRYLPATEFIEQHVKGDSLAECSNIIFLMNHLHDKTTFCLENIL
ncbi:MAG: DUF4363 family protein [Clostridiales bacterium]|jgi:hypothetical protein|nr:DUF4363 family protein [Clostridiales bacterium]